jgi:DNA polymerase (family 10)
MADPHLSAIALLEEIQRLMEMKGANPFKIRAFEKAQGTLSNVPAAELEARAHGKGEGKLTDLPGIGKGIAEVLTEFLIQGKSTERDELRASLPEGLAELTAIPGLGPKKALQVIEELGIKSVAELEYACRENRLLKLKGFGEKAQHKVMEGIEFMKLNRGKQRLDEAFVSARAIHGLLTEAVQGLVEGAARVSEAGPLRRRAEVMSELDFVVEVPESAPQDYREQLNGALESMVASQKARGVLALPVRLGFASTARFGWELARATATSQHWSAIGAPAAFDAATEEEFFERLKLPMIPPEARETGEEVELARSGGMDRLLPWDGIQGVFHNHTTRSDGRATLEEMVVAAKQLGYKYIGISDHSQSAVYAQGLKVPDLLDQEREIRDLQEKHPEIRIFWGIESDILADGSLDYEAQVLKRFDFVVASIHSRFQMDRDAMTARVLEAVRNPCTRFLGHATGRLLLGRVGFDMDMEKVISEAARCGVAIEINANPARLDIDWRWGPKLREYGTEVSVNPDAHETAGLEDTLYGIAMARKALLPVSQVVNARSVAEVEKWLKRG